MKTCPVCCAVAFDDASVCYGCLHRFDDCEEACSEKSFPSVPSSPVADSVSACELVKAGECAIPLANLPPLTCSIERRVDGGGVGSFGHEVTLLLERADIRAVGVASEDGGGSGGRDVAAPSLQGGEVIVPHASLVLGRGDRLIVEPRGILRPSEVPKSLEQSSVQGFSVSCADTVSGGSAS